VGDLAAPTAVEQTFREDSGRALATLIRLFGDVDVAEEAVQEAFVVATERWPTDGIPPSPAGWIITTARRKAIDRLRRESTRHDRQVQAALTRAGDEPAEVEPVRDDQLRLIFTCCHPALNRQSQVALTLKLIAGLSTAQIARAFVIAETTLAQRIVRAKSKIKDARIPYRVPRDAELPERLQAVLTVVYLIYNEGYLASGGDTVDRLELRSEAIRLARVVSDLMPDEPEAKGLLAQLLLTEARSPARTSAGRWVPLADQDRSRWDQSLIDEGQDLLRWCLRRDQPGRFQVQAAINAVHSDAAAPEETDWRQIVHLYDVLLTLHPTPIVELNRAIAISELEGPQAALNLIEPLDLDDYYLWHVSRAQFLVGLGRTDEAAAEYRRALTLTDNPAERHLLTNRLSDVVAQSKS
jgi:RNA polymerase sigma-70 factor (ECF subfamily)